MPNLGPVPPNLLPHGCECAAHLDVGRQSVGEWFLLVLLLETKRSNATLTKIGFHFLGWWVGSIPRGSYFLFHNCQSHSASKVFSRHTIPPWQVFVDHRCPCTTVFVLSFEVIFTKRVFVRVFYLWDKRLPGGKSSSWVVDPKMKVSFVHAQTGNVRHSMPIKSAYRKSGPYPGLWGSSGNPIGGVRGNVDHPPPLPTFWWVGSNPLTRPFPGCQVSGQNFYCRCATGTHAHLLCSSRPSHVFFFPETCTC